MFDGIQIKEKWSNKVKSKYYSFLFPGFLHYWYLNISQLCLVISNISLDIENLFVVPSVPPYL